MDIRRIDQLISILDELIRINEEQFVTKLELEKCRRITEHLGSFSSECEECSRHFLDFEHHIQDLREKSSHFTEIEIKTHKQKIDTISSHLQKQHKLVTSGYYLSIFMSIGVSLGVVFGFLLLNNIALGIPIGMSVGLAIGAGLDQDAKKKGNIV